jgi:hypothetical protein
MNLKEGTRRLALLLGAVGAILGGFASYMELQTTLKQRASYIKFERFAASDVVQQERRNCLSDNPPRGYAKLGSQLQANGAGIEAINWTEDCKVENLETDVGEWLYPGLAPRSWEYLLIALFPVVGFFIPWGAVRAIGWVGAGFVTSPK